VAGTGGTSCTSPSGCATAQYCDFSNNRCTGAFGSCQARPQGCTANVDPVCGCDGVVYSNACLAAAAGTDISDLGGCTPPAGTFACGPRFCMRGTQFCEARVGGAVTNPGAYACQTLPAGCGGTPTCACLQGASQCTTCTVSNSCDATISCMFP
jgi:Kazal-type serine protease inhibitor domain